MLTDHQQNRYSRLRRAHKPAAQALTIAREFTGEDYGSKAIWSNRSYTYNPIDSDGLAWIESAPDAGLRFVGYCDEINRHIRHNGWYGDEFGDSTYRGVVLQRQAVDGYPCYLAGYEDPHNPGSYRVELRPRDWFVDNGSIEGEAKTDAASRADRIAEIVAEREREYQYVWSKAGEAAQKLADANASGRAAIKALRQACSLKNASLALYGIDPGKQAEIVNALLGDAQAAICDWLEDKADAWRFVDEHKPSRRNALIDAWRDGFAV